MQLTNRQPRPDLNDGQQQARQPHTALHVILALQQVRAGRPIKTLRVPK